MNRRPLLLGTAIAAAAVLVLSGCAGNPGSDGDGGGDNPAASGPDYGLVEAGTLTICSEVPYVPFEFEGGDNGTGYTGFDIDLAYAIAQKLDLELSVQDVSFDGLQSGTTLIAGTCDMGASAMTITEDRKKKIDFSDPYYDSLQSLLTSVDSGITSISDLAGSCGRRCRPGRSTRSCRTSRSTSSTRRPTTRTRSSRSTTRTSPTGSRSPRARRMRCARP